MIRVVINGVVLRLRVRLVTEWTGPIAVVM
jgi:hypothetical protein